MATGITDAAETASIGKLLSLSTLSQNTPAYFKTKITVIFMLLVHRTIHNVFACRKLGNVLWSSFVLELSDVEDSYFCGKITQIPLNR